MSKHIHESRKLLQNPYAYLSDTGEFDVNLVKASSASSPIEVSRRVLKNQYAHLNASGELDTAESLSVYGSTPLHSPTPAISKSRRTLGNPYAYLDSSGGFDKDTTKSAHQPKAKLKTTKLSRFEQMAHEIHVSLWESRHQLWPNGVPSDPTDMLDPSIALKSINFSLVRSDSLGQFNRAGRTFEVAGVIDRSKKQVSISRQLPFNTQRFTAAHELGHAIMHSEAHLHRDRPLDGSNLEKGSREKIEVEADKFASCFLMPQKLLRKRFKQLFGCETFSLNEATSFALDPTGSMNLTNKCKTIEDLARILAKTTSYNGRRFYSLAEQFHVSTGAMAIRLEQLKLIDI